MKSPRTSNVGSDVAVFGAIAPFEKVVVAFAGGVCALRGSVAVSTLASAVSVALTADMLFPAAESTHVFRSVRLIRLALSARAFATVAGGFDLGVSAVAFFGDPM
jgi:hypothetical protein